MAEEVHHFDIPITQLSTGDYMVYGCNAYNSTELYVCTDMRGKYVVVWNKMLQSLNQNRILLGIC